MLGESQYGVQGLGDRRGTLVKSRCEEAGANIWAFFWAFFRHISEGSRYIPHYCPD